MVNNIENNTISEISAKKDLNKLNKIKNVEIIKYKMCIPKQKELLNLLNDLLETTLTDETLMLSKDENEKEKEKENENKNENENENENEIENENENENENEIENENDKTLMLWNDADVYEIEKILISSHEYVDEIKQLNNDLDEIIDKSKSFEDQIKLMRKVENITGYWHYGDYGDKELKFKYFNIKLAHLSNIIDEKLFEQIFSHKIETLANKLINKTNKEENQIIANNIKKNKDNFYKGKESGYGGYDYVI